MLSLMDFGTFTLYCWMDDAL